MAIYVVEAKLDQQKLIDYVGEDIAKLFFSMKSRLKSPENDIYYWLKRSPKELEDRLSELQVTKTRSQKDDEASKGAELLYNQDGWKVYHITTYPASVKYGKNTQWCIAGSKRWSNGERGEEYFNDYTRQGVEFYFYIKSNDEKYALALTPQNGNYQVFNQVDDDVSNDDLSFLPNVDGLPTFTWDVSTFDITGEGLFTYKGESNLPPSLKKMIKKIKISEDVTELPNSIFYGCESLKGVIVPSNVTKIGVKAFYGCRLLVIVGLREGLIEIGSEAFENCSSLKTIRIPNSVTTIGSHTFCNCKSLATIYLPETLRSLPTGIFSNCSNLYYIELPKSIGHIEVASFKNCLSLTEIILPGRVVALFARSFEGCYNLEKLVVPNSVEHMFEDVFQGCDNLTVYTDNEKVRNYCEHYKIKWKSIDGKEESDEYLPF